MTMCVKLEGAHGMVTCHADQLTGEKALQRTGSGGMARQSGDGT